ncbi:hypothetical protein T265_08105 [Opisthorchis viverrini]|uniref:RhoGAP domain protein n=3 Tax=Opisthorchis viverrini TaxID=6198 RepID=A0A074ZEX3_OPIVI|nr:hypothetical protein T265_08105 [Opisthorchis viverrini]KER24167.1 hypothetical protein T265_08105 [Opisthorchis viverrini]
MTSYTVITIKPSAGSLGFTFEDTNEAANPRILSVNPNGNAFKAGLRAGQTILSVGPTPVAGLTTVEIHDLVERLAARFGDVTLHVADDRVMDPDPRSQPLDAGDGDQWVSVPFSPTQGERDLPLVRKQAYRPPMVRDEFTVDSKSIDRRSSPVPCTVTLMEFTAASGHAAAPSPQISYKPRHTQLAYGSTADAVTQSGLGAVARLAIDGGLSADELMHIGHTSSQPGPVTVNVQPNPAFARPDSGSHTVRTLRYGRSPPYSTPGPQRLSRPVCQPISYCTTQPIRASQSPDWPRGQHWSRARQQTRPFGVRNPLGNVTSTAVWYSSSRRGSFPLQMTRVGGLILHPTASSSPDSGEFAACKLPHEHRLTYQSMSACTSPTSGKHANTSSSSPSTTFFSASAPSPLTTPPLPVSSAPTGFRDIVRLGPGDTVVHAAPGDTIYNVTDLIRMHDCPQPYVSMSHPDEFPPVACGCVPDGESVQVHDRTRSPLAATPPQPKDGTESGTTVLPKFTFYRDATSNPTAGDLMDFRHSTPDHFYPQSHPPQFLPTRAATGFSSPPGPQVARTVRHLRRIRHIFGNPLDYESSNNSASLGALVLPSDKVGSSTNSLVEIRSHGSRSVDSVRPSSYTCKCPPNSIPFFLSDMSVEGASTVIPPSVPHSCTALVRFEVPSRTEDNFPNTAPWERYYLRRADDTLIMTHLAGEPSTTTRKQPTFAYPYLAHMHVTLSGGTVTWQNNMDQCTSSVALKSDTFPLADPVFGTMNVLMPEQHLKCHIILDRQLASSVFGSWGPEPAAIKSTEGAESEDIQVTGTQTQSRTNPRRIKPVTGRSSSLGLAGPAGGMPLFRAVGTAAASVGMPLIGRAHLPSWLQTSSSTKTIEISNPIPITSSAESANGGMKPKDARLVSSQTTPKATSTDSSKKVSRSSRGWFHQAWHPMRRVATASDDPCAHSRTSKMTSAARRFASTHGILTHSKSTTASQSDIMPSQLEHFGQIETEPPSLDVRSAVEPISSPAPLRLAACVSPTPALQSPYVTYLSPEASDFPNGSRSSPMPSTSSHEDILKAPTMVFTGSSSDIDSGMLSEHSAVASITGQVHHVMIASETFGTTPAFVPLPQPLSGPLPLHKCPRSTLSPFVPFIVELCVTLVERYGLNCVGLYRLSGSKTAHDFISLELRKPLQEIDIQSDKWNDIHAICGVLKTFLRTLPDSLFPKVMYTDFLNACRIPDREKRLLSIQRLLGIMECYPDHPEYRAHRATLRYLATHLARVSARETVNKMTIYNLALVFAPNLVQPREETPELLMSDSKYKIMLVETVIKYHSWIFSPDLGIESGCSIPTDSVEELPSAITDLETTMMRGSTECGPLLIPTNSMEGEESANQPGRVEGDVQPLLAKLLNAAAGLPPPPSGTDLETAVEPGPESDRPSDIALPIHRRRFTSIPTSTWSAAALRSLDPDASIEGRRFQPELLLTQETEFDAASEPSDNDPSCDITPLTDLSPRPRQFSSQLGTKLDNLRHLSQGCLDQYTNEARQLGERVAESRRQLQIIVTQRLHAEQLLHEARNQRGDQTAGSDLGSPNQSTPSTNVQDFTYLDTQEEQQPSESATVVQAITIRLILHLDFHLVLPLCQCCVSLT